MTVLIGQKVELTRRAKPKRAEGVSFGQVRELTLYQVKG